MFIKALSYSALCSSLVFLSACGSSDSESSISEQSSDLDVAVEQIIDRTIVPAIGRFKTQSNALNSAATSFCANNGTTSVNLSALQTQWHTTNQAWFQITPFKFGPLAYDEAYWYIDNYHERGLDSTTAIRSHLNGLITGTDAITDSIFENGTANKSGLPPIEMLIFEASTDQSTDAADVLADFQNQSRKCEVLTGYTTDLLRRAEFIETGWNSNYRNKGQGYRDLLINEDLENVFAAFDDDGDGTPAIERITIAVQDYFDLLANHAITTEKNVFANQEIWNALNASVEIVEEQLAGHTSSKVSLFAIMTNNGHEQGVTTVEENIQTFKTAVNEQNATDLTSVSSSLDGNFKNTIPDGLNVNIGLTFTDGDG